MPNPDQDYADEEVTGLERLLPSRLSKGLAIAFLTAPFAAFQVARSNPSWFLSQDGTWLEETLLATTVALIVAIAIAVLLIADLAYVLASRKHRRVVRYTAQHPTLSATFLWQNTRAYLKLVAVLVVLSLFALGYFFASI